WAAVIPMVSDALVFSDLEGRVSVLSSGGYTFYDADKDVASVQVKRDVDEGVMNNMRIIFEFSGNSVSSVVPAPNSGGTKVYSFDLGGRGVPSRVSVAPIFVVGEREKVGVITSGVDILSGVSDVVVHGYYLGEDYPVGTDVFSMGSLINSDSWIVGTGSVSGYSANGAASENEREMGIGPYGNSVLLWKAIPDSVSGADGGWNGGGISIDSTKSYRSTVWIKKTGSNGGSTYFGCHGSSTNNLNGVANTNPYFWAGDLPMLDRWYLLVGYIHGSGDSSTTSYGGIYDGVTGEKVISMTDYKNKPGATTQVHRTYLYYDTTITDRQYFWSPTFVEVSDFDLPYGIF
ncbi:MAG: hypothetical protein KJ592_00710, partial [Nanoarchaeota archaeon]|nr:hypothetical protein [Nanoarchaeota archaeon]